MSTAIEWDTLEALDIFHEAYVTCACWVEDILFLTNTEEAELKIDCIEFITKAKDLMAGLDISQCGHDFWLTRNHHGSGFWDRGYPEYISKGLTELSHSFGEFNIFGDEE